MFLRNAGPFNRILALAPVAGLAACLIGGLSACNTHKPNNGGGVFGHAGGPVTIQSTEITQKSVRMVDMRSGEVFFTLDIPIGKQITFDFDRGDGDDAVYTPDIMRYEVKDIGDSNGKLKNSMTAPNAESRRIDVFVTQSPQYANQPPISSELRTDKVEDRPDWWTPRGGALPENSNNPYRDN